MTAATGPMPSAKRSRAPRREPEITFLRLVPARLLAGVLDQLLGHVAVAFTIHLHISVG